MQTEKQKPKWNLKRWKIKKHGGTSNIESKLTMSLAAFNILKVEQIAYRQTSFSYKGDFQK
jgi:hypothetical protein